MGDYSRQNDVFKLITPEQRENINRLFSIKTRSELEFRFRNYNAPLNAQQFKRIIGYYDSRNIAPVVEISEVYQREIYEDGVKSLLRQIKITNSEQPVEDIWQEKRELYSEFSEFPWKIAISRENDIWPETKNWPTEPSRIRYRNSYDLGSYRLDCTYIQYPRSENLSYSVELEVVKEFDVDDLARTLENIAKILFDTNVVYTSRERDQVVDFFNRTLLGSEYRGVQDKRRQANMTSKPLVKPRAMDMDDFSDGSLFKDSRGTYNLAHKTDGVRKILVVDNTGLWLVYPTTELNLIQRGNIAYAVGLVADGELIPEAARTKEINSKYMYQVYDCLAVHPETSGSYATTSVQRDPHSSRMITVQKNIDRLREFVDPELFNVATKRFIAYNGIDDFFDQIAVLLNEQKSDSLSYLTDGVIMVPENDAYYNKNVLKWKPTDKLTIDFLIRNGRDGGYELHNGSGNDTVMFSYKGFDEIGYLSETDGQELPLDEVYEFKWSSEKKRFIPYRQRDDKDFPNSLEVAQSVFRTILQDLDESVITGTGNRLMRRYHNSIKRELLKKTPNVRGNLTLLDLGSGRGGDVSKWAPFARVVAVEPDADNAEELQRRIDDSIMRGRVRVVRAKAQDTEIIYKAVMDFIGDKVSVVSIFNSLNLIAETPETLRDAINTVTRCLTSGGYIHLMFLDAKSLMETMRPSMNTAPEISVLDLKIATISLGKDREVYFRLPGTIINEAGQREYQVRQDDLIAELQPRGFSNRFYIADKNRIMSNNERALSSLYTYGTFIWDSKSGAPVKSMEVRVAPIKSVRPFMRRPGFSKIVPTLPAASEEIVGQLPLYNQENVESPTVPVLQTSKLIMAPDAGSIVVKTPTDDELVAKASPKPGIKSLPAIGAGRRLQPLDQPQRVIQSEVPFLDTYVSGNDSIQGLDIAQRITYADGLVVYHIATLNDDSSIFHAILKAVYPSYGNNKSYNYRHNTVLELRRQMADVITDPNIAKRFDSVQNIKRDDLDYVAAILGLTIWLVKLKTTELEVVDRIGDEENNVVLYVNDNLSKAEPVGVMQGVDNIRVKFSKLDTFLGILQQLFK